MTTIDHARLRALAEAAQEVESVGSEWHSTEGFHEDCGLDIRDAEYLAAIDPPTLIALLDERERLISALGRIHGYVRAAAKRALPVEYAEWERLTGDDDA